MKLIYYSFLGTILLGACKKSIEVTVPQNQINSKIVFSDDATAIAAIAGIYSSMMETVHLPSVNLSLYTGLSSDEFVSYSNNSIDVQLYTNSLQPTNDRTMSLWRDAYKYIYEANSVIEGLNNSGTVTAKVKTQLLGEAKFIRAFCHFYLLNLFGDIPLVMTTDYRLNAVAARSDKDIVYRQIVDDLNDAKALLSAEYVDQFNAVTDERVRPNKWAATAMLARVYLYMQDWPNAVQQASEVIGASGFYQLETDLNSAFLKESKEAIWQLKPVYPNYNTWEGLLYILTTAPNSQALSGQLLSSFETGDKRFENWVGKLSVAAGDYYYPAKYKIKNSGPLLNEYSMVLRLAEQFLIRAEGEAQTDNPAAALNDINAIRERAGLADTTAVGKDALMDIIIHERQVELFTEWGHRWLDLKRTGRIDGVMELVKGANWQPTDFLYPVPLSEIKNDHNLTQNPGY